MTRLSARLALAGLSVLAVLANSLAAERSTGAARAAAAARALSWMSNDPMVVAAVRGHNANPTAASKAMTQEKWKALPVLDPFVRGLSKNPLAEYLKGKRQSAWSELFVSGADGTKVALFNKTTNWSHLGKPKHDVPMQGRTWIGEPEVDASAGVEQIQIGLPVFDGGKAIGSIVIGLAVSKLQ